MPRQQQLLTRLQHGPVLIGDGGMGTQLYEYGAPLDAVFEYLNLIDSDLVSRVHQDYVAAGAEIIETNTFGANHLRLSAFGLEEKTAAINRAGARLARQAAGDRRWVAGAIGPVTPLRGDASELPIDEEARLLREQMQALIDGGVDCLLLETFPNCSALKRALNVARTFGRPVIAQLAFSEGGFTADGLTVEEAAAVLAAGAPAVIGANCGAGPRELRRVLERLAAATTLPVSVFPNSGFPEYVNGRHIYLASPDYFADLGRKMAAIGATLVGGCCGTGPDHIRALHAKLAGSVPGARPKPGPVPAETAAYRPAGKFPRPFHAAWGRRPIVTVELEPPKGLDVAPILQRARQLAEAGVDAINLAENPLARIRMGNLALASRIQNETATEVIVHMTGRDRNLIGLHSDLMGAHLLGIRSILAVTGDPVAVSGDTAASNVFDVNSIGLLELLTALNHGRTTYGADLQGRTSFLPGAAFNPNPPDLTGQLRKLEKKMAAGARFVQTQPVYDAETLQRLVKGTEQLPIPVLMGIMPLVSERNAEFLHNEVPGIVLPASVRARMRGKSGAEGVSEGFAIASELVTAGKEAGLGGFYLIPPFGKVDLALKLIAAIRRGT